MLIFYVDGTHEFRNLITHPESYDSERRPSESFLKTLLNADDVEAIYFEDPAFVICINGFDYSMALADSDADIKNLDVNETATALAIGAELIGRDEVIRGTVVFVLVQELG